MRHISFTILSQSQYLRNKQNKARLAKIHSIWSSFHSSFILLLFRHEYRELDRIPADIWVKATAHAGHLRPPQSRHRRTDAEAHIHLRSRKNQKLPSRETNWKSTPAQWRHGKTPRSNGNTALTTPPTVWEFSQNNQEYQRPSLFLTICHKSIVATYPIFNLVPAVSPGPC